jgi:secondary thiamine-phosphate synthase enzyme
MIIMVEFKVKTGSRSDMIDITRKVQDIITKENIKDGVCVIFIPHTTAAVTINENADPDVVRDILKETDKTVPYKSDYLHAEGNSAAHIKASMFGFSEHIIIENGRLVLGTWQGIYFCEFDGPRHRKVYVKILK